MVREWAGWQEWANPPGWRCRPWSTVAFVFALTLAGYSVWDLD